VNASPLILLAKAGHLELLRVGGVEVRVPDAVITEIEAHGMSDAVAVAVRSTAWLRVVPTPAIPDRVSSWSLGAGESAVLAVALETPDCEAILDDRAARRCARVLGLPSRGSVGLVLAGKAAGAIPSAPSTPSRRARSSGSTARWSASCSRRRDRLEHFSEDPERWRPVYNAAGTHEAIGDEPPACRWCPSPRRRPPSVPEVTYKADAVLRKVGPGGEIRWHSARTRVGLGLAGKWARMIDGGQQVEVYYSTHRVRCVPVILLRGPRRL
jgi:predicted nucleic acid-binding protein